MDSKKASNVEIVLKKIKLPSSEIANVRFLLPCTLVVCCACQQARVHAEQNNCGDRYNGSELLVIQEIEHWAS
jgi:hypothetical protein